MADNRTNDEILAELTQRARSISQDATTKVTSAMRDMIGGAAGIAGFAVESARDLVQYMVRRGQMTQDEADKLIREAEATHLKRPKAERDRIAAEKLAAERRAAEKKAAMLAAETAPPVHRPVAPGRLLAQGAGKSVKAASDKPGAAASESAVGAPKKGAAKTATPVKAATPATPAAPAKSAPPARSAAPAKPVAPAKAPAKAATKAAPAKAAKSAAPAKKSAAKAPAKKAVKKRR